MYSSKITAETAASYAAPAMLLLEVSESNVICLSDGINLTDLEEIDETW